MRYFVSCVAVAINDASRTCSCLLSELYAGIEYISRTSQPRGAHA